MDYHSAIHWLHNNFISIYNAEEVFPQMFEDYNTWGDGWNKKDEPPEIFEYLISDCSEGDIRYLTDHFPDLLFLYNEKLDRYFLCVDHWGTSWDYVWTSFIPDADGIMLPDEKDWDKYNIAKRKFSNDFYIRYMRE